MLPRSIYEIGGENCLHPDLRKVSLLQEETKVVQIQVPIAQLDLVGRESGVA